MRAPNKTFRRVRKLRRGMSLPEVVLWYAPRNGKRASLRLRRQHPIGPYIPEFSCAFGRLAIEVDGFAHDSAAGVRQDDNRQAWFAQRDNEPPPAPPPARFARHLPRAAGEEPHPRNSGKAIIARPRN